MYGALLGVAGGVAGGVGSQMTADAMENASQWYNRRLAEYYARERGSAKDYQRQYEQVGDDRMGQIGATLGEYMSPTYNAQPSDTAGIDAALAKFSRGNSGAGGTGAASGWGAGVQERTNAATGRQRGIAGDASMLRRIGDTQSGALTNMGMADDRFGRRVSDIQTSQSLRNADFARELQGLNAKAQNRFSRASRAGSDWTAVGGYMGAGGQLMDAYGATQGPSLTQQELGYNPDTQDRGSRVRSYQFN